MLRPAILMLLLFVSTSAAAICPPRPFNYPSILRVEDEAALILTHASVSFDPRYATKPGVDAATVMARRRQMPVIYLEEAETPEQYFAADCEPDYRIYSEEGELPIDIRSTDVHVAGGHLELCLKRTVQDILASWSRHPAPRLQMTFLMDAIYSDGSALRKSDPYNEMAQRFMSVVGYGRSGPTSWAKLTLLETLGIIGNDERRYDYLQRILPPLEYGLPAAYRVELQLNDAPPRILRRGTAGSSMLLRFRFVDSAAQLMPADADAAPGAAADGQLGFSPL